MNPATPPVQAATLRCGLQVVLAANGSDVIHCGYVVRAGTRHEAPADTGLAHFIEHMSFKGTARRRACHISNGLERVGGDLNAYTNKQETVYQATVLRPDFGRAADLLTDIVFHSTYPQAEIDKEVEVICDEIESYNDSPSELIYDEFENMLFCGHPLGHNILGRAELLRTFTTADALRFTGRLYRPGNAVFFAYGDIAPARLARLLDRALAGFPACPPSPCDAAAPAALPAYRPQERVSDRATHQAHVLMGNRAYSAHDGRRMALYLLNNILGGPGMNARLNVALRERNGLVYTVDSSMVAYSDTGVWCAYFGCDPHDVPRCRRLVRSQLDRVMRRPMPAAQLAAAKRQIKGQIAVGCDNRESFALDFGKSYLHYGRERDVPALLARIDAITAEEIQQVARETFAPELMTTLIYK